jgi:hypothetical protein
MILPLSLSYTKEPLSSHPGTPQKAGGVSKSLVKSGRFVVIFVCVLSVLKQANRLWLLATEWYLRKESL